MVVHCIQKLANSWRVRLSVDPGQPDKADCWNLTYGNFNRKRYYILAHEMTMLSFLLFELTPKNFARKVEEKLSFWSSYYGFPDLSSPPFFNTKQQLYCKNNDKSINGMVTGFKGDLWHFFADGEGIFEIELKMHQWIFLPMKDGYPIDYFMRFVEQKVRSQST
jgi:hypothetical protein